MTLYGAIDCGTNSTRLLVGDVEDGVVDTVHREMHITRLGQGVDATGELAPEAVDRTIEVLTGFAATLDRLGAERVRMTATSAARDASNRADFFDRAEAVIGSRPELISGAEEAELSFAGATADLSDAEGPVLVVDIGGGSTEFAVGGDGFDAGLSVNMGAVRFSEAYLHGDPPRPEELSSCIQIARSHLDDVLRNLPGVGSARTFVGLAGTVSAVAAVEIGLAEYDRDQIHHFRLGVEAAEDVFRTLATESLADRIHNPGLDEARADVIVAGCCILVAIFRHFGFEECIVSEADILDGLVLSQV